MKYRRGFSSPNFEQGGVSEFDRACEVVAKSMWDSEPVVYAWGPQERRNISWEDAVERNLAGVKIFRTFAIAAVTALNADDELKATGETK